MINLSPFRLGKWASFVYSGTPQEGLRLLSKSLVYPSFQLTLENCFFGKIGADSVQIWLGRPYSRSFLVPVFTGKFEIHNGRTILRGTFRFPKNTRMVFVSCIVATIFFWAYVFVSDYTLLRTISNLLLPMWLCLCSVMGMLIALQLSRAAATKDMKAVMEQVERILASHKSL